MKYYFKSNNAHGVHSPFVFKLYNDVVKDRTPFYCFEAIELLRKELELNYEKITVEDYGAGSRKPTGQTKTISEIARSSLTRPKYAQLLFRLINWSGSRNLLELGTSLGITTSYLASVNPNSKVFSFEGDWAIAQTARNNFDKLGLKNINLQTGPFEEALSPWLASIDFKLDFVFLDGNHRYNSTLEYFDRILPHLHEKSIVVLDDIRWSNGMEKVWNELRNRKEISVSIDLFQMGVLFFKQDQEKQNFLIRY